MFRDQGPMYNMGFGAVTRNNIQWNPDEKEGLNQNSGFIAKKLHDHPVMRFFAAGATTLVAAAVAGAVAKRGGVKLGLKLSETENSWIKDSAKNFRSIQEIFDGWQGVHRDLVDPLDKTKFFTKNEEGKIIGDHVEQLRGFFFTKEEGSAMLRYGRSNAGDHPTEWTLKREIQQRLVSQARRLPYELPAAYVVQRGVADKVLGQNNKPNNFHWYNPLDVVSDLVTQSVKNTAFAIMPFEAGGASMQQGWRKLMTYGDDLTNLAPGQQVIQGTSVALKAILGQVGADAQDLLQKTVRMSSQVTGSFATGLQEAQSHSGSLTDYLYKVRHGLADLKAKDEFKNLSKAQQRLKQASWIGQINPFDDLLPGPFSGLGSGLKAARSEWTRQGAAFDEYQKFLRLGSKGYQATHPSAQQQSLLRSAMGRTGSPVQELAGALNKLVGDGPGKPGWKGSRLYSDQLQNEYAKSLARQLKKQGANPGVVDKFITHASIQTPGPAGFEKETTKRINFGRGTLFADNEDDFYKSLVDRMNFISPRNKGDLQDLVRHLPNAIQSVDTKFQDKSFMKFMDRKISTQWSNYADTVLPHQAAGLLKPMKADYGAFIGKLTPDKQDYLRLRAAQLSGIQTFNNSGTAIEDSIINTALAKRGLDYRNAGQLRAYLISKGGMSKPWQAGGRNIFGFKNVSLASAIERKYFTGDTSTESTLRDLTGKIGNINPIIKTTGYKLGGVFEGPSGQVVDIARIGRGFRGVLDRISTDFQIPLIHLQPLDLVNYKGIQGLRNRSILQYVPSRSAQPFLRGASSEADSSFHMWMRSGIRGSKGQVTTVGIEAGRATTRVLSGTYRPLPATGEGLIAHHTRLAAGEPGAAPEGSQEVRGNWLRKILKNDRVDRIRSGLSFADDDSTSVFGYLRRFRNRHGDINNPLFMARLISGETVQAGKSTYELANGEILKDGAKWVGGTQAKVASAVERLQYSLRPYGMGDRPIRGILGTHPDLLNYVFQDPLHTITPSGTDNLVNIHRDVITPSQIIEAAEKIGNQDANMAHLPQDIKNILNRAYKGLVGRHLADAGQEGYWNVESGLAHKSSTVYSRMDELKTDLEKYVILRQQALAQAEKGGQYSDIINDLMSEAQKVRANRGMTQSEFTEFRTALLSLQVNYQSFASYIPNQTSLEDTMNMLDGLMHAGPRTQEALRSYGRGEVGVSSTKYGKMQPFLRRALGIAPASSESGINYNAFGDTKTVFAPTFGTAFRDNPLQATLSASGLNTWGNTGGFSSASIPMSHFIERLNKPFQFLGMGLEQGDFKGPLDFYARGLVGKRMLPLLAGGAGALAVDRTIGGYTTPKDQYGHRVYKPFVLGGVATAAAGIEAGIAGAIPGGMTAHEKWEQLKNGEVPVREGRFWPLGNTPFMGGRIQYFRPSWYKRMMSGYQYTDQEYGSPLERLGFDYDFSPLRPLDPYRFEREHYMDRPYPVTGDYFTGPWGPMTSVLNATVGKVLKPHKMMHKDFMEQGLAQYAPVGEGGAYFGPSLGSADISVGGMGGAGGSIGVGPGGHVMGGTGGVGVGLQSAQNQRYAQAGSVSLATASRSTRANIGSVNQFYSNAANITANKQAAFGIPSGTGMPPRIIPGTPPLNPASMKYRGGQLGYEAQELLGAYGFAAANAREALGFGNQNFIPQHPVLASASNAYGTARSFWDLNLGGTGDVPSPFEGNYANLELSEILRRFIPKPRTGIQAINPIPNAMGIKNPWLPGADYFNDYTRGDPYTKITEGEMRLPGAGYERLHNLHPDQYGQYGLVDRFKILGDVAPWSNEYHALDRQMDSSHLRPGEQDQIDTTRSQVAQKNVRHIFTPYQYKYQTPAEMIGHPIKSLLGKYWEGFEHNNTYFNTKFLPVHTATEDWERENVYGSTFPEWQHPIKDFLKPMVYTATQRNPVTASVILGAVGTLFGANPRGKATGAAIGAITGLAAGGFGNLYKAATKRRYIPEPRREQMALEEYTDVLEYVKDMHLYNQSMMQGNTSAGNAYRQAAQQTMYGADIYNGDLNQVALGIPDRKRDYFKAMLSAPVQERSQILSTAPRLERRLYEAAWGMKVEKRPDLGEYFQNHELPGAGWEGWHPNSNMDQIKVKIGQSMGIDMSEMGYYPQQIQEANLVNPSYPSFNQASGGRNVRAQLEELLRMHNVHGHVQEIHTPYPGNRLDFQSGVGR